MNTHKLSTGHHVQWAERRSSEVVANHLQHGKRGDHPSELWEHGVKPVADEFATCMQCKVHTHTLIKRVI
jgi:hypothetical protein